MKNKILIINQVFWPDTHNTARLISELAVELVKRGWKVTALVSNRSYLDHRVRLSPKDGSWNGVSYKRVYIPPLNQKKNISRLLSSLCLIIKWITKLPGIGRFDAIIIGTNPPFAYLLLPFLRTFKRKSKLILWSHDLYPEAITVTGGYIWRFLGKLIKPITKGCLRLLDVIVDIGPCMRNIYKTYQTSANAVTLTPWAFVEPPQILIPHLETRNVLFGDAKIALLYSGTIGNAHEFGNFLLLARELQKRNASVAFCFAGFGNCFDDLKKQVTNDDKNIRFAGFVSTDKELEQRLSTADFMLISLKDSWTGISVPSKYFGALAAGKAILFSGSKNSSLCKWTKEYNLGYYLTSSNTNEIADLLHNISINPELSRELKGNAFKAYQNHFSKKITCDGWHHLLKKTIC